MKHSIHGSHVLLMLICCLMPIGVGLAIIAFGISLGSFGGMLPYALVLLCPLLMLWMMRSITHEEHNAHQAMQSAEKPTAGEQG